MSNSNRSTLVISAFPCCGKSYFTAMAQDQKTWLGIRNLKVLDSDSSNFSHVMNPTYGVYDGRNPQFPRNYIKHIKNSIGEYDIIFVSSHLEVRQALQDAGIEYYTVYPYPELKAEWIGRSYLRGDSKEFIDNLAEHFDAWTGNIENEPHGVEVWHLSAGEFLSTLYKYIVS